MTHAGTAPRRRRAGVTAGGRVLNVTALGADVGTARAAAYAAADMIDFHGKQTAPRHRRTRGRAAAALEPSGPAGTPREAGA